MECTTRISFIDIDRFVVFAESGIIRKINGSSDVISGCLNLFAFEINDWFEWL